MVKKVKMFFVFLLFAMIYPLASRQVSEQKNTQTLGFGKKILSQLGITSAQAGCCPPGTPCPPY